MSIKTKFAGASPFRDPALPEFVLAVTTEPLPSQRCHVEGKYHALFKTLQVGQCIQLADPKTAPRVAAALAKMAKQHGKPWVFRSKERMPDGIGRVWVLDERNAPGGRKRK